jgi:hypothetical protein
MALASWSALTSMRRYLLRCQSVGAAGRGTDSDGCERDDYHVFFAFSVEMGLTQPWPTDRAEEMNWPQPYSMYGFREARDWWIIGWRKIQFRLEPGVHHQEIQHYMAAVSDQSAGECNATLVWYINFSDIYHFQDLHVHAHYCIF